MLIFPHVLAVIGDRAGVLGVLGGEDGQQGGLARPVAADEPVNLPGQNVQVQVVEDLVAAVRLAKAPGL